MLFESRVEGFGLQASHLGSFGAYGVLGPGGGGGGLFSAASFVTLLGGLRGSGVGRGAECLGV